MDIKSHTNSVTVAMAFSLFHVQVTPELVAYKLGRGPLPGQPELPQLADKLALVVEEGLASARQVREYLAGRSKAIKPSEVRLAHPTLREALRTLGFDGGMRELHDKKVEPLSHTPFTDLTEGGASVEDLVRLDFSSHMMFAVDGTSLPVATYFDYIGAGMNDGHYDLVKAVEILKKDPRVRFVEDKSRRYGAQNGSVIQDVPYYNARPGSSKYIQFWFMPTPEDAVRLWEKQKSYGTQYPSTQEHRAIFDLDVLGLRAGGAAKYEDFYKSDEHETSSDDSDD